MYADGQIESEQTVKAGATVSDKEYYWDVYGNPDDLPQGSSGPSYYVYNDDRLVEDLNYTYLYDDNGSMIKRTNRQDSSYELYNWDHRGKMTSATAYNSAGVQPWKEQYQYDALGRLSTTTTTDGSNPAVSKHSIYDGLDLAQLLMELDDSDRVTKTVLAGAAVDMIMAEEKISYDAAGAATVDLTWLLSDYQGTPQVLLHQGASPTVDELPVRTAFGEEIAGTGSASTSGFGFQGHEEDSKTGFTDFRARQMQTNAGRFISQDPIRFDSGQTNHYQFVGNRPHMGTDPSGLAEAYGHHPFAVAKLKQLRKFLSKDAYRLAFGILLRTDNAKPPLW